MRPLAFDRRDEMADLTLVASRPSPTLSAEWSHDIRNVLAIIGLHLDTLQRLSGPHGAKAVSAAHALVARAASMCTNSMAVPGDGGGQPRRRPFDITATIRQVADLIAPLGPEGFRIDVSTDGPQLVLGHHADVFRVLFNLLHNALTAARSDAKLRRVEITVERAEAITMVRIADVGGGLPPRVAARLFRIPAKVGVAHGHGLAIARELMERNGGMLSCETSRKGTVFRLEFAAVAAIRMEGPVTRSLGRRAMS
jgi:signal transduction histidine kinase